MPGDSKIEWTEKTWNPVTGCTKVSPGCAHCYAETFAERWRGIDGHPYEQGFDLRLWPGRLAVPLRWRKPRMIFVNSMSDLFHDEVPDEYIAAVFGVMAAAPRHTFQVLTKRPERMARWFRWHASVVCGRDLRHEPWRVCEDAALGHVEDLPAEGSRSSWPLGNVWLGVTIENRRYVHRADLLRQIPAAVRFVSAEPLLGPLQGLLDLSALDWLIAGGESGGRPGRALVERVDGAWRPKAAALEWVRDLRDACEPATAFYFKQWGGPRPAAGGRELDGCTWDELPAEAVALGQGQA